MKLTKRFIDSISVTQVQKDFWDSSVPGFGIRVSPQRKMFVLMFRLDGRLRRMTLGRYGILTVEQARKAAADALLQIRKEEDPTKQQKAHKAAPNIRELCEIYLERHAQPFKRTWRNDVRMIRQYIVPTWGRQNAHALSRPDIARLHQSIGKEHPHEANRTLALIRKMFNLWRDWGFFNGENPATRVTAFPEEKRDRFVTHDELPRVLQAIREEPDIRLRGYFFLKILLGARKSELLTMKWEDVDLSQGVWRKPRTRAGRSHILPLPVAAIKILNVLPRWVDNPHVFPGEGRERHLVNVTKPWKRIRETAGVPDVRFHDLRRTLGSWLAGAVESLALIGTALDHSNTSTTAIYARFDLDPLRKALEDNAVRMLDAAGIEATSDIVTAIQDKTHET